MQPMRWKDALPSMISAVLSLSLHGIHLAAVMAAAGAAGAAGIGAHSHHYAAQGVGGAVWTLWLGWGANALTLYFAVRLFVNIWRCRRQRVRFAPHLAVSLAAFGVALTGIAVSL
ncbi:hypothetical protein [Paenibacillus alkalitolerans]|uniref:hypothetical protein n=1 Tax=Paenibacillus alkalitolerans TaxID=2799335 RepID=UPI0018F38AEC|nr:hypothetical protein [Paenibacillus alkalitolerans]